MSTMNAAFSALCAMVCVVSVAGAETLELPAGRLSDAAGFRALLGKVPVGDRELGGCAFRISGEAGHPRAAVLKAGETLAGIEVGGAAGRLWFLHAVEPGVRATAWTQADVKAREKLGTLPPDYPVVGRYVVRYRDGEELSVPVRWAEGVHDWNRRSFFDRERGIIRPMTWAHVALDAHAGRHTGRRVVLYAMHWPNPRPDVAIERVDAVCEDGTLVLFGVSKETEAVASGLRFVAPGGDDRGPGTLDRPWATPEKAFASAKPGETVFFRAGTYALQRGLRAEQAGAAGRWTTFSAFPGETPVLDAEAVLPAPEEELWSVCALRVAKAARHVRVRGLTVQNCVNYGIHAVAEDIEILHNTVYRTYHTGVWGSGKRVRVIGNRLIRVCETKALAEFIERHPELKRNKHVMECRRQNQRGRRLRHECLDCGSSGSDGVECGYNEICWGDKEGIDCKGGPRNVRIHHNYIHHISMTTGLYVDGWTRPMVGIEVDHNVVCNTRVTGISVASEGGSDVRDVWVHHNLSFLNGCSGLLLSACNANGKKRNIRFENNTLWRNGTLEGNPNAEGGIHLGSQNAEAIVVRNNICYENRDYGIARDRPMEMAAMGITIEHNLVEPPAKPGEKVFKDEPKRPQKWIHEPGKPAISGDPMFVDAEGWDFRLKAGSPAIGAGRTADGKRCDLGAIPFGE